MVGGVLEVDLVNVFGMGDVYVGVGMLVVNVFVVVVIVGKFM